MLCVESSWQISLSKNWQCADCGALSLKPPNKSIHHNEFQIKLSLSKFKIKPAFEANQFTVKEKLVIALINANT